MTSPVTAVVISSTREGTGQTLRALLAQERQPERLLLVDGALDGVGEFEYLLDDIAAADIDILTTTLGADRGCARSCRR